MRGFYLFGFTQADAITREIVVDDSRVCLHPLNAVVTIATEFDESQLQSVRLFTTHHRVLTKMLEYGPVIPLQTGVIATAAEIDALLEREYAHIERLLVELAGCIEANVKAVYDEPAVLQEIASLNPAIAKVGRDYVSRVQAGERIAELLEQRRDRDSHRLIDVLAPFADRAVLHPPTPAAPINASFLLRQEAIPQFETALSHWSDAECQWMRTTYIAPLPPYSFVYRQAAT